MLLGGANGEGILMNFRAAGVAPPERLVLGDASRLDAPGVLPPRRWLWWGRRRRPKRGRPLRRGEGGGRSGAAVTEGEEEAEGAAVTEGRPRREGRDGGRDAIADGGLAVRALRCDRH